MEPWFYGQGGEGLTLAQAKRVLGPGLSLMPKKVPKRYQDLIPILRTLSKKQRDIFISSPRLGPGQRAPGAYRGVRGLAFVWPDEEMEGGYNIVPAAVYNSKGYRWLSEQESREIVETQSLGPASFAGLPGGQEQVQAPEHDNKKESSALGPVLTGVGVTAAVAAGLAYFLMR